MRGLLSFPYPIVKPEDGYWAPVTSTINWCEEDYYATIYSAEIVNTLTNVFFMSLGVRGIKNCLGNGHDTIFLISFIGFTLVGAGSFAFHSTLKYPMQLVDELSMIYTTCLMAYASFSYSRSKKFSIILALGLLGLSMFITLYYHYLQNPDFHQNAFSILAVVVLLHSILVMEVNLRPSLQKGRAKQIDGNTTTDRQTKRDWQILSNMWCIVIIGLSLFLGGFGIWSLDNHYCAKIRQWRHEIGLPFGFLLEGHGWWHIMTGAGSYFLMVWGIWLRHCLNGRQDEYVLVWPNKFLSLPDIVRAPEAPRVETKLPHTNGNSLQDITNQKGKDPLNCCLKKIS